MGALETVFITGGTSGVGGSMAEFYAREGFRVVVGYGSDDSAAEKQIELLKGMSDADHAAIKADITDPNGRAEIFDTLHRMGGISQLVLAASGGLEKKRKTDDPFEYARLINKDAQVAMAEGVQHAWGTSDKMARRIIFLTSHQAWYLKQEMSDDEGRMQLIAPWDVISAEDNDYGPIAVTKREGVNALTKMQSGADWNLGLQTTDLIPDSKVARAAAMFYYAEEGDRKLPREERLEVRMQRLIKARQNQLERLGLNTKLYMTAEFAGLAVARAIDPAWIGVNHLILPDHMNQDTGRRLGGLDPVATGLVQVQ